MGIGESGTKSKWIALSSGLEWALCMYEGKRFAANRKQFGHCWSWPHVIWIFANLAL
ncbi:hypothetical protein BDU57DRAFT_510126 [Ampelomyces quisqualis]|uniref:Uncharacterized protein n=1 Tax=Ampelomyces quisqualis TaxID=50730 RepID=A0A6A5R2J0_AMPQU|nr:hypothetical protein BDU57DRAFT_510126 [Ampelomyces quisqualis]